MTTRSRPSPGRRSSTPQNPSPTQRGGAECHASTASHPRTFGVGWPVRQAQRLLEAARRLPEAAPLRKGLSLDLALLTLHAAPKTGEASVLAADLRAELLVERGLLLEAEGQPEAAAEHLALARRCQLDGSADPLVEGELAVAEAYLLGAQGRWAEAAAALTALQAAMEEAGEPTRAAAAWLLAASAHLQAGAPERVHRSLPHFLAKLLSGPPLGADETRWLVRFERLAQRPSR